MAVFIQMQPSGATAVPSRYRCKKCDVRFEAEMLTNVSIEVFAAQANALRCPGCGAGIGAILMGEGRRLDEDEGHRIEGSIEARKENWKRQGERGLSADAIFAVMSSHHPGERHLNHPHDTDDLRRCLLLLKHIPEWRTKMHKMARCSPEWAHLAKHWEAITAAYERDCPNYHGASPEAYALMKGTK